MATTAKKLQYEGNIECAVEFAYKDGNGRVLYNIIPTSLNYDTTAKKLQMKSPTTVLSEISLPEYTLPQATSTTLGGIKLGFTQVDKNYPVVLDSNGKAYVNVPWTDTTYTFTPNNPTLAWGTTSTIGTAGGATYKITMPAKPYNISLSGTTLTITQS